ncbi:hypothetical protein BCT58_05965 [Vibrio lentus]|nr:hypothetical protein BCT58_05965 [Vibrio lentus]
MVSLTLRFKWHDLPLSSYVKAERGTKQLVAQISIIALDSMILNSAIIDHGKIILLFDLGEQSTLDHVI